MVLDASSGRLVVVCFADVAGFTRLTAADEPTALRLVQLLRDAATAALTRHEGDIVKSLGDGVLLTFSSAASAVLAALEMRHRFDLEQAGLPGGAHTIRVGLNLGEVTVDAEGDIFGDGVNRAFRLQENARPGRILVSEEIRRVLRQRPEFRFREVEPIQAKGLDEPLEGWELGASPELAAALAALTAEERRAAIKRADQRHTRAVAIGVTTGLVTFVGLGIWTAMHPGSEPAPGDEPAVTRAVDATGPAAGDDPVGAGGLDALPVWPAMLPATAVPAPAPDPTPAGPVREPTRASTPDADLVPLLARAREHLFGLPAGDLEGDLLLPLVRRGVDRAAAVDVSEAEREALRGLFLFATSSRWPEAEEALRKAIDLEPRLDVARRVYALLLSAEGRHQDALFQLERARDADAPEDAIQRLRGAVLFRKGDYGPAERELERALSRAPSDLAVRLLLARTRIQKNEPDEADEVLTAARWSTEALAWLQYAVLHKDDDDSERTRERVNRLLEEGTLDAAPYAAAAVLAAGGQHEAALNSLEEAERERDPALIWIGVDPEWSRLRSEPRYRSLVTRVVPGRY